MPTNPPPDSQHAHGYGELEPDDERADGDAEQGAASREHAERVEGHNRQATTGTDETAPT